MPQQSDYPDEANEPSDPTSPDGPPGYDDASNDDWSDPAAIRPDVEVIDGDDEVWPAGEIEVPDESPPRRVPTRRSSGASGVVAAAMLGLGEILEPEKTEVEIVQVDDQPLEPPAIKLDFSDVPPGDYEPPDNKAQL